MPTPDPKSSTATTPWKELRRERVLDRYLVVDNVQYELPTGERKEFYIRTHTRGVCGVALTPDNQVIMTQQFRPGPGKVLLELTGGFINEGEDPAAAMARELLEETGYAGEVELVTASYVDAYSETVSYNFVIRNCRLVGAQHLDKAEFINVVLVGLNEFRSIVRSGQMSDVRGGLLALDHLGLLGDRA